MDHHLVQKREEHISDSENKRTHSTDEGKLFPFGNGALGKNTLLPYGSAGGWGYAVVQYADSVGE